MFNERISYEVTLRFGGTNSTTTANNSDCAPLCSVVFTRRGFNGRNFTVYLQAVNSTGKSDITTISDSVLGKYYLILLKCTKLLLFCAMNSPDLCGVPQPPLNGSVGGQSSLLPVSSEVTYRCDDGLFPTGVMTSTCTSAEQGQAPTLPFPQHLCMCWSSRQWGTVHHHSDR